MSSKLPSSSEIKIVVSAGGTGGHIIPARNVCRELLSAGVQVFFIGNKNSMEESIIKETGIPFYPIDVQKLYRSLTFKHILFPYKLWKSIRQCKKYFHQIKPDAFIGFGGFVSGAPAIAAKQKKIPIYLQEQNAKPGITNIHAGKFADTIFLAYPESIKYFPKCQTIVSGNPITVATASPLLNDDTVATASPLFNIPNGKDAISTEINGRDAVFTNLNGKDAISKEINGRDAVFTDPNGTDAVSTEINGRDAVFTNLNGKDATSTETNGRDAVFADLNGEDAVSTPEDAVFSPNQKLFILGGSQGSMFINNLILENLDYFAQNKIDLIWQTGKSHLQSIKNEVEKWINCQLSTVNCQLNCHSDPERSEGEESNCQLSITLFDFTSSINDIYSSADYVITRGGAMSLAEIESYRLPAFIIPLPSAAVNEQYHNAKSMERKNCGMVFEQKEKTTFRVKFDLFIHKANGMYTKNETPLHITATQTIANKLLEDIRSRHI